MVVHLKDMTTAQTKLYAYSEKEPIGQRREVLFLHTFCIAVVLNINPNTPQRHKLRLSLLFHLTVYLIAVSLFLFEQ